MHFKRVLDNTFNNSPFGIPYSCSIWKTLLRINPLPEIFLKLLPFLMIVPVIVADEGVIFVFVFVFVFVGDVDSMPSLVQFSLFITVSDCSFSIRSTLPFIADDGDSKYVCGSSEFVFFFSEVEIISSDGDESSATG